MVAKKRNTLRQKSAVTASKKPQEVLNDIEMDMGEDPKAFLHQYKESKKDKNLSRQQMFLDQIKQKNGTDPSFAGISKSAMRRRKRKLRDDLKPKMGELLTSLGQEEDLKEQFEDNFKEEGVVEPEPQKKRKNEPNIRNQKGAKALSVQESERMKQVLSNSSFQQNTFSALRDVIKMQNR
ncbi:hypothetical protein ZYGR_0I07400 [Zygosaccharomyces rouxii]|uniref:Ribosome biogenesis protein SLX9 n=2 Tax=Zygosaccharomyces rouxii TaxID=4956 RepID=C5DUK4_ZYGRC|nr:uncharacterized protein ZYRO0C17512g [Zygosaccharomyces rouxii]KAH9201364.1 ribosome biogenesis protein SLX9-domain-containing protein [Zygosaccharomyces rouxii]GAV48443.1 hypothetical protein ZYGR_0I07400 [Zygosaccharomyces rouxii]CAR27465.1 ZYRO0C17512p [Zygosaccharomyces rouxii]